MSRRKESNRCESDRCVGVNLGICCKELQFVCNEPSYEQATQGMPYEKEFGIRVRTWTNSGDGKAG